MVWSYLGVEFVAFQERVGHVPLAKGLFQSRIPCGWPQGQSNYQEKFGKVEGDYPHKEPSFYRTCASARKGLSYHHT